ncbi:MAG: GNAT family N-acetyltransferase [Nitrospirae bacterium]|nr:GNAT family N-acetyltransferase [Nitrospirota bacterium]MBI3378611.1 GNAT family N-acetyltransferase [Nitrospirota bacterium]
MFCAKTPRFIEDGRIRLRPLRVFDGPFLMGGLKDEDILSANGLNKHIASSWFFAWWWMKKTFMPAYCIECASGRIGFIGLYNLILGKSAEMTLVIFDRNNRRMGYGTMAFKLLAQCLQRHSLVKEIRAKVTVGNHGALSFWRKAGFVEIKTLNDIINMSIGLDSYHLP